MYMQMYTYMKMPPMALGTALRPRAPDARTVGRELQSDDCAEEVARLYRYVYIGSGACAIFYHCIFCSIDGFIVCIHVYMKTCDVNDS